MKVVTFPRTGSTKICFDLAAKYNVPFVGELNPAYSPEVGISGAYNKKNKHEIPNCQPHPTLKTLTAYIDDPAPIRLINRWGFLVADQADYIVLRRDVRASLESLSILIHKHAENPTSQEIPTIVGYISMQVISEISILLAWCLQHPEKQIIWFEDYFPEYERQTYVSIKKEIVDGYAPWLTAHLEDTRIQEMVELLWTTTHKK